MPRIPGIDPEDADGYAKQLFNAQREIFGAPLLPYLLYARRPTILRAVRGMWAGLDASGLIEGPTKGLVNRRVARLNGCVF